MKDVMNAISGTGREPEIDGALHIFKQEHQRLALIESCESSHFAVPPVLRASSPFGRIGTSVDLLHLGLSEAECVGLFLGFVKAQSERTLRCVEALLLTYDGVTPERLEAAAAQVRADYIPALREEMHDAAASGESGSVNVLLADETSRVFRRRGQTALRETRTVTGVSRGAASNQPPDGDGVAAARHGAAALDTEDKAAH